MYPLRVLILSPYPERIAPAIEQAGDRVEYTLETPFNSADPRNGCWGVDRIVSFGYRHILPPHAIAAHQGQIYNIHISILPWNRGAHPNVWAWLDGTPHGASIHLMTSAIDKGPILAQRLIFPKPEQHTFQTSYDLLMSEAVEMFAEIWPRIRHRPDGWPAVGAGSYHNAKDLPSNCLPQGWGTPVLEARALYQHHIQMFSQNRTSAQ